MWRPRTREPRRLVAIDPGLALAFVALDVDDATASVVGYGKAFIARTGVDAQDLFTAIQRCDLGKHLQRATTVLWEKQRGWIEEHTERPFLELARLANWDVVFVPPSEKFHRLGVGASKDDVVRVAADHFQHVAGGLGDVLRAIPVDDGHDIADAALFLVMHLESRHDVASLRTHDDVPPWARHASALGAWPLAAQLARRYQRSAASTRLGANVRRRIAVGRRIAACTVARVQRGTAFRPRPRDCIRLTRNNLRLLGACRSEAADLAICMRKVHRSVARHRGCEGVRVTMPDGHAATLWGSGRYLMLARADWGVFARVFVLEQRPVRHAVGTVVTAATTVTAAVV